MSAQFKIEFLEKDLKIIPMDEESKTLTNFWKEETGKESIFFFFNYLNSLNISKKYYIFNDKELLVINVESEEFKAKIHSYYP